MYVCQTGYIQVYIYIYMTGLMTNAGLGVLFGDSSERVIYTNTHVYRDIYIYIYIYTYTYIYAYIYIYTYTYIYAYMYICIHRYIL